MNHGCSKQILNAVAKEDFHSSMSMRLAVFLALYDYDQTVPRSSITWELVAPVNLFMISELRALFAVNKMHEVNRFLLLRVWQKYADITDDVLKNLLDEEDRMAFAENVAIN